MRPPIGPTHEYEAGKKLEENDRGGLNVAIAYQGHGRFLWTFGTRLQWATTTPEEALMMVNIIHQQCLQAGIQPDAILEDSRKRSMPFKIGIDIENRMVKMVLNQATDALLMDGPAMLYMARKLEESARTLVNMTGLRSDVPIRSGQS